MPFIADMTLSEAYLPQYTSHIPDIFSILVSPLQLRLSYSLTHCLLRILTLSQIAYFEIWVEAYMILITPVFCMPAKPVLYGQDHELPQA